MNYVAVMFSLMLLFLTAAVSLLLSPEYGIAPSITLMVILFVWSTIPRKKVQTDFNERSMLLVLAALPSVLLSLGILWWDILIELEQIK